MNETASSVALDLADCVAFVTGGASGIGLGIARALVGQGTRVVIADNNAEWGAAAVAELGPMAFAVDLDVSDRMAWGAASESAKRHFGPIDVLVNNAGIGPDFSSLDAMSADRFDRMLAIKVQGTFNGIQTFVPGMRQRKRGHVVNTASMAGLIAIPQLGAYTAAKFAVVGLSEVLRAELANDGIGVSVLCPGLVDTRLRETSERAGIPQPLANAQPTAAAIDAAMVGDLVVAGIRANHPLIVTHGEYRARVAKRMERILEAFDRVPDRRA